MSEVAIGREMNGWDRFIRPAISAEAEIASWFLSCASAKPIARNEGGDRSALLPLAIPHEGRFFYENYLSSK
jgi:hypothetical protein